MSRAANSINLKKKFLSHIIEQSCKNPYKNKLPTLDELKRSYISLCLELTGNDPEKLGSILNIPINNIRKFLII